MVMSCFMGSGRPGMEVSDFIFMSISCSIRSPTGHFNFNSTGPLGGLKVECSFSLPDLLQPTQDRLKASEVAIRTRFLFMVGGFLDCESFLTEGRKRLSCIGHMFRNCCLRRDGRSPYIRRPLSHAGPVMSTVFTETNKARKTLDLLGLIIF